MCNRNKGLCSDYECKNCLSRRFSSHPKSKYWSIKNNLTPQDISIGNGKDIFLFNCDKCQHELKQRVNNIVDKGRWCAYCTHQKLCGKKDCAMCFNNSFASTPHAKYMTKNNKDPLLIFKRSKQTNIEFYCEKCKHTYIRNIGFMKTNNTCPYCAIPSKIICNDTNCKACFERSFASHPKAKFWSIKNKINPRDVLKGTESKYYFNCEDCGHRFKAMLSDIAKNNSWCKFCSHLELCKNEECKFCFDASFASHSKAKYWSKENDIAPRFIFKGTNKKFKFVCEKGHKFELKPNHIVHCKTWCSRCINKTEQKLYEHLSKKYEKVSYQYKPKWCISKTTKRKLAFDFALKDKKIIIELDGGQHFKDIPNWGSSIEIRELDKYKMEKALEKNYSVIRLLQQDVWNDKNKWSKKLKRAIRACEKDEPKIVYICEGKEYDIYK